MDVSKFSALHRAIGGCLCREARVLQALIDALVTAQRATPLIELSQSPCFPYRWASVYKALARGHIDRVRLRRVLVAHRPEFAPGQRLCLGIDLTPVLRPCATTLADRTLTHVANTPPGATPVLPGWAFVGLVVLPAEPSAATYPLELRRVLSTQTPIQACASVLADVVPLLEERPLLKADREFGNAVFLQAIQQVPVDLLVRMRQNFVAYHAAPPPTGKRGHPTWDGAPLRAKDATTQQDPDARWVADDGQTEVVAWHQLHFKAARDLPFTVYRVTRQRAAGTQRDPRVSWFLGRSAIPLPLSEVVPEYRGRFSQEHGHRFLKQDLRWAAARLRTPERFQTWTDVVGLAWALLIVAQPLVTPGWRPWDQRARSPSLAQTRRGLAAIYPQILSPPPAPKPRGKSAGRPPGFHPRHATRHPVIRKSSKSAKTMRKMPG